MNAEKIVKSNREWREEAEAARAELIAVRERCAKVCERVGNREARSCPRAADGYWPDQVAFKCASAIREMANVK